MHAVGHLVPPGQHVTFSENESLIIGDDPPDEELVILDEFVHEGDILIINQGRLTVRGTEAKLTLTGNPAVMGDGRSIHPPSVRFTKYRRSGGGDLRNSSRSSSHLDTDTPADAKPFPDACCNTDPLRLRRAFRTRS